MRVADVKPANLVMRAAVDEEQVHRAIALAELRGLVVANGADQFVGELLGGQVLDADLGMAVRQAMPDGVEQVGLAEADAAVDEERIVGRGGVLGHGQAGGLGELVGRADDERLERVPGIEGRGRRGRGGGDRRRRRGGGKRAVDGQDDVRAGPEQVRGGRLEGGQVMLLDVLTGELVGHGQLQAVIVVAEKAGRADPVRERLGGKVALE